MDKEDQEQRRSCSLTFWKCPTWLVESTRWAAFPKNVWTPVAITTASSSPCLHVEPEYTPSPGLLVTGSDSPVKADCNMYNSKNYNFSKCEIGKQVVSKTNSILHLVNFQGIAFKQTSIRRNYITKFYTDNIPRHQLCSIFLVPFPVPKNLYNNDNSKLIKLQSAKIIYSYLWY